MHSGTCPAVRRFLPLALLALILLSNSGCVDKKTVGDQTVYTYSIWVAPLVAVIGILLVPLGWWLRNHSMRACIIFIILGPAILIFLAPNMSGSRVIVDASHFETTHGHWWSRQTDSIDFADTKEIRLVVTRKRRSTSYNLLCTSQKGSQTNVSADDLVQKALPEIFSHAQAANIAVVAED